MIQKRHRILFFMLLVGAFNLCMAQSKYSVESRLGYGYDRLCFTSINNESNPTFKNIFKTKAHSAVISMSLERNITIKSKKMALGIFGDFFRTVSENSSLTQRREDGAPDAFGVYINNQLGTYFESQTAALKALASQEIVFDTIDGRPRPRIQPTEDVQLIDSERRPLFYGNNPRVQNKSSVFNFGGYISIPVRISDKSSFQCRPGIGVSYNKIHYEIYTEDIQLFFPPSSGIPPSSFPNPTIKGLKYEVEFEQWVMIPKMDISYIYKVGSRMSMHTVQKSVSEIERKGYPQLTS